MNVLSIFDSNYLPSNNNNYNKNIDIYSSEIEEIEQFESKEASQFGFKNTKFSQFKDLKTSDTYSSHSSSNSFELEIEYDKEEDNNTSLHDNSIITKNLKIEEIIKNFKNLKKFLKNTQITQNKFNYVKFVDIYYKFITPN